MKPNRTTAVAELILCLCMCIIACVFSASSVDKKKTTIYYFNMQGHPKSVCILMFNSYGIEGTVFEVTVSQNRFSVNIV